MPPDIAAQTERTHIAVRQRQQRFTIVLDIDERNLQNLEQGCIRIERRAIFTKRSDVLPSDSLEASV